MSSSALLTESGGQGWNQLGELGVAVLLSALIGLEPEVRQKSAGIRTYTVVGLGSALVMPISKYGSPMSSSPTGSPWILPGSRRRSSPDSGSSVPGSSSCAVVQFGGSLALQASGSPQPWPRPRPPGSSCSPW